MKYKFFLLLSAICLTFFVYQPAKAEEGVDLKVEDITANPSSPEYGKNCSVVVRVKNNGTISLQTKEGFGFEYDFGDFAFQDVSFNAPSGSNIMKPGEFVSYTFRGVFFEPTKPSLSFTIDSNHELGEINEDNNTLTQEISILGNDLLVEEIKTTPAKPAINQDAIITVKVKNNGTFNLTTSLGLTSFNYRFDNFDKKSINYNTPAVDKPILPGEYVVYVFEGKFNKSGESNLLFTEDTDGELYEKIETNNSKTAKATVVSLGNSDLSIDNFNISTEKPLVNENISITVKIKNTGDVSMINYAGLLDNEDINANFSNFVISTSSHDEYPSLANPLEPDEIITFYYGGRFSAMGTQKLSFSFDKNNRLAETKRSNNATSTSIRVYESLAEADAVNLLAADMYNISSTSVIFVWTTDRPSTGRLTYREGGYSSDLVVVQSSNASTTHRIIIEKLKDYQPYEYQVSIKNSSVEKDTEWQKFTTMKTDNFFISKSKEVAVKNESKTATFRWSTNLASVGKVYYKKKGADAYLSAGPGGLEANHQIIISNLTDGEYEYYLSSVSNFDASLETPNDVFVLGQASAPALTIGEKNKTEENSQVNDNEEKSGTIEIKQTAKYQNLKGKIILKVESKGEAYWISPKSKTMYSLGRPADAYQIMRSQGVGISDASLSKIPIGLISLGGIDSDQDGLVDAQEEAIGTDKDKADTDGDGYGDKAEISSGFSPVAKNKKIAIDSKFAAAQAGKIFLQVESRGEAWYINPKDGKRYFLGRPNDAFAVMRSLGLGISDSNFEQLQQ